MYCRDSTTRLRRRESAPLQFFGKRKPTIEQPTIEVRDSLVRFTKFREHERINRLSMGIDELAAYQAYLNNPYNSSSADTIPFDQSNHYQSTASPQNTSRTPSTYDNRNETMPYNGNQTKKFSVQFQLSESTDVSDYGYHNSRHSMPAIVTNAYVRGMRRNQTNHESRAIKEEAIEEFEDEHCMISDSMNNEEQSSYHSPPSKFYKQNIDPYPSNSESSSLSEALPISGKCPEKPKRLLFNSKQTRRLLTEAHFTSGYRNYQIQTPYYSDSSSMLSAVDKFNQHSIDTDIEYTRGESVQQLDNYQIDKNDGGGGSVDDDEVEYSLPCVEIPEYQQRQNLPNCLTSDDSLLAGEVFQDDPQECVRMFNENYESSTNTSISIHEVSHGEHRKKGHIMITDLDKSTDSVATFSELDISKYRSIRKSKKNNEYIKTPNRILEFHETMQCADIICLINEFNSMGKMETKSDKPLYFEWGTFKNTPVTVRKYDHFNDDHTNTEFKLITETALIQDANVLRYFFFFIFFHQKKTNYFFIPIFH